ncbi:hypothetical protein F5Y09DRAFT_340358 [Xylaria sp. FL1042]|nr:hypothetical protein F5Y09DRAFT_340358 [Xylaria sp. FL1042]
MISSSIGPGARHSMAGLTSDGTADTHQLVAVQPDIPRYNIHENSETIPKYTREYLHKLSMAVDTRLKINDDELSYYTEALAKTQKVHKYLMSVLLVLAFLWLVTSIILLIVIFKGLLIKRA